MPIEELQTGPAALCGDDVDLLDLDVAGTGRGEGAQRIRGRGNRSPVRAPCHRAPPPRRQGAPAPTG